MAITPGLSDRYVELGLWTDDRIGDLIPRQAERFPDRELFAIDDQRVTYGQFHEWVTAIARQMASCGVGPGDRVVVQLPNCLEALVLQVAAFRVGALNVPVIPIYREHETRQILADTRPAVIAVAASLGARTPCDETAALLAELGHRPVLKYAVGGPAHGWTTVPRLGDAAPHSVGAGELPAPAAAEQPALILYTSGTTSAPKGPTSRRERCWRSCAIWPRSPGSTRRRWWPWARRCLIWAGSSRA